MTAVTTVTYTGNDYIDGILYDNKWASTPVDVSFPGAASNYGSFYGFGETSSFSAMSSAQITSIREVHGLYSLVSGITFNLITESDSTHATIRYGQTTFYANANTYQPSSSDLGGDSWYNWNGSASGLDGYVDPRPGTEAYYAFVHETGHSINFKHGHDPNTGSHVTIPTDENSYDYSVMTYVPYIGGGSGAGVQVPLRPASNPQSPMAIDCAGAQYLYGAAPDLGPRTWYLDPADAHCELDGVAYQTPVANILWRCLCAGGAGPHTIDASDYTASGGVCRPRAGQYSTFDPAQLRLYSGQTAIGCIQIGPNTIIGLVKLGSGGVDCYTSDQTAPLEYTGGGTTSVLHLAGNQADYTITNNGAGKIKFVDGTSNRDNTVTIPTTFATITFADGNKTPADFNGSSGVISPLLSLRLHA